MPSLLAYFGLDASQFKTGLDKAVAEAQKKGPTIERSLMGALKQSSIFNFIASPIGAASTAATAFIGAIIAKVDELQARAKQIKIGAGVTGLSKSQYQDVLGAAEGSNANIDALPKSMEKIAEAQQKVKTGGEGADKALKAFSDVGISLKDIQSKNYTDLFLEIANSMHVAKLSGDQLAAGQELLGKGFEGLLPAFQRGFNDPVDQMKKLSDEEIDRLNRLSKNTAIFKSAWSATMASIANAGLSVLGLGSSNSKYATDDANEKRQQALLDAQQAKKAAAANDARQQELNDAKARDKNEKEAKATEDRTAAEEKAAKLRALPAPQRLEELKKETAELEAQAKILAEKLKTERDAASAPELARVRDQIAKNQLQQIDLQKSLSHAESKTDLNANQRIGAFAGGGPDIANQQLQVAKDSHAQLTRIATYNERLVAQWQNMMQGEMGAGLHKQLRWD